MRRHSLEENPDYQTKKASTGRTRTILSLLLGLWMILKEFATLNGLAL